MARILEKYKSEVVPKLMERFGYKNRLAVPKLMKIVVNMGVGRATESSKRLDDAVRDLALITGQRPAIAKARKSVAGFRLRTGLPIGCKAVLRGARMYEFFDRLVSVAIPRIRDFRGLRPDSFDGNGNYTLGIAEQAVFPEVNMDDVEFVQGMDVTFVTSSRTDEEGLELLRLLGLPFRSATAEAALG